nr:Protein Y16E11A.2 [Haemonchus contortus]
MRSFCACLLCFCEIVQSQDLWDKFSDMMSDNYEYQGFDRQYAVALAYFDVLDRVATMGRDLREVIRPPTAERPAISALPVDYAIYERSGLQQYESLSKKKREPADDILAALYRAEDRCIFLDGPGGSGKTYLYSTVYSIALKGDTECCV